MSILGIDNPDQQKRRIGGKAKPLNTQLMMTTGLSPGEQVVAACMILAASVNRFSEHLVREGKVPNKATKNAIVESCISMIRHDLRNNVMKELSDEQQ